MNPIEQRIHDLEAELQLVHSLCLLQSAQIEALTQYVSAHLSDVMGADREAEYSAIRQIVRKVYDQKILALGDKHPGKISRLDIRPHLSKSEQDLWFLPEFPDSPPPAE